MQEYFDNFYTPQQSPHVYQNSNFLNEENQIPLTFNHQSLLFEPNQNLMTDKQLKGTNFTCEYDVERINKIGEDLEEEDFVAASDSETTNKIDGNLKRKVRNIEVSSLIQLRNQFTFSGSKNDTVELNINFKTLFVNYFTEQISKEDSKSHETLQLFEKTVPSFKSMRTLMHSQTQLSKICQKYIRSGNIIKGVFGRRTKFWMKLQMIKYIEALNMNLIKNEEETNDPQNLRLNSMLKQPVKWKSIRKKKIKAS